MRRRYQKLKNLRLKIAATRVQKWWRKLKKISYKPPPLEIKTSTTDQQGDSLRKLVASTKKQTSNNKRRNLVIDLNEQSSKLKSSSNVTIGNFPLKSESQSKMQNNKNSGIEEDLMSTRTYENDETSYLLKLYKDHSIDKVKLMKINEIIGMMSRKCSHLDDAQHRQERAKQMLENEKKLLELSVKSNLLADKQLRASKAITGSDRFKAANKDVDDGNEGGDELPISYRLNATKCVMKHKEEQVIDTFKEKFLLTKSIRQMEDETHKQMREMKEAATSDTKRPSERMTNDQRFFQKIFGNMNLGSLKAVDKAYEERNQSDKVAQHRKKIDDQKQFNKVWHQQIYDFKDDIVKEAKTAEVNDRIKLSRLKAQKDQEDVNERQRIHDLRERNKNLSMHRRRDIKLAVEFSKQHLSVSKALQSHERHLQLDKSLRARQDLVIKQRADDEVQRQLVKRYLEQRNVLRVVQANNEKQLIKFRVNDELMVNDKMARERVDIIRSSKERTRISLLNNK